MAPQPTLAAARRFRAEQELREVLASGSAGCIEAACRRAEAAGVARQEIDRALAVARGLLQGGGSSGSSDEDPCEAEPRLQVARRLRAEEELRQAAAQGNAAWIESTCARAAAAGLSRVRMEAALGVAEQRAAKGEAAAAGGAASAKAGGACVEVEAILAGA